MNRLKNHDSLKLTGNESTVMPSIRVLLVEDDAIAQRVTQRQLEVLGCKIDVAGNGQQACQKASDNQYDLIFMDLGLPDDNGCIVTEKIKSGTSLNNQATPVVALTAHANDKIKQHCLAVGMVSVLIKPIRINVAHLLFQILVLPKKSPVALPMSNVRPLAVIDWSLLLSLANGDIDAAHAVLTMLADALVLEKQALVTAFEDHDIACALARVRKLLNGLCYCGVPRLQLAVAAVESALSTNDMWPTLSVLYQKMLSEMDAAIAALSHREDFCF